MNRASRMKDTSKIEYYGAFASALGFVIHCGNKKGCQLEEEFNVFRGLQLLSEEFSQNYKVGETLNLKGFTSTTLSRAKGLKFALSDLNEVAEPIKVPILLEINFKGKNQYFSLNSMEYSAYHGE